MMLEKVTVTYQSIVTIPMTNVKKSVFRGAVWSSIKSASEETEFLMSRQNATRKFIKRTTTTIEEEVDDA